MKTQKTLSPASRIISFGYALSGLKTLILEEPNALIHFLAAVAAVILGFVFKINSTEWLAIVLSIAIVFAAELFNTSLETMCDFSEPNWNAQIKRIKDLSAGAVLVCAIGALIVGLIIFIPKIF